MTTNNFQYSPQGSELKKQTVIAGKQYQVLSKYSKDGGNKDKRNEDDSNE